jgi:ABC-2 type transport system ATP-binding protein
VVSEGEFFGVLGPNGAGKTTTPEIIEGLRKPDSGEVLVLGLPAWLPAIGVLLAFTVIVSLIAVSMFGWDDV